MVLAELLHSGANRRAIHLFTVVSVGDGQTGQDVEVKKLNYNNQTMKEKFDQAREQDGFASESAERATIGLDL